jgi:hypothetical protein
MGLQHYAISEAAVLLSALVCLVALIKGGKPLAALAAGLLGLAGAIGVVRFGLGRVEALKVVHQLVSQMGGLTAMGLMAAQFVVALAPQASKQRVQWASLGLVALSLLIAALEPFAGQAIGASWLVVLMIAVWFLARGRPLPQAVGAVALASLMLVNALWVRKSAHMTPEFSWHLYHGLVSVWLLGVSGLCLKLKKPDLV